MFSCGSVSVICPFLLPHNYTFTATTTLKHDKYIWVQPGSEASVFCTPVSIDVDLVYSVDRRFQLKFELLNELDMFAGRNEFIITIIENGNKLNQYIMLCIPVL